MTTAQTFAKANRWEGWSMLNLTNMAQSKLRKTEAALVPIKPLAAEHLPEILKHLKALSQRDRYLRFGYVASDEQIHRYVDSLDFSRDEIYGIFNSDLHIIAMAHLAIVRMEGAASSAEFGVSVAAHARGRGYGARLFERAVTHARNEKVYQIYIHALSENAPMIRIARNGGAEIDREGAETEAFLRLPKRDLDSRLSEFVADQYAKTNYSIKEDAKRFWSFLAKVQEIREGVREARHQAAE